MRIYPAIDLREGATVQLVGGDPNQEAIHEPEPLKVALRWTDEGASALHLVDLDAAIGTGSNLQIVQRILNNVPLPVQLGGGVRHLVDIQRRLDMGVGRVIIGTQGIKHPDWLQTAAELYPDKIVLAVDARGDDIAISGWQEGSGITLSNMLRQVEQMPLAGVLYTNVDIEGKMGGVDRAAVEHVIRSTEHEVIASGGIADMNDLDILKDAGAAGAVLGMSLYTGRISLKAAIERIEGRTVETGTHVLIPRPAVQWGGFPAATDEAHTHDAERPGGVPPEHTNGGHPSATSATKVGGNIPPTTPRGAAPQTTWGKRRRAKAQDAEADQ